MNDARGHISHEWFDHHDTSASVLRSCNCFYTIDNMPLHCSIARKRERKRRSNSQMWLLLHFTRHISISITIFFSFLFFSFGAEIRMLRWLLLIEINMFAARVSSALRNRKKATIRTSITLSFSNNNNKILLI